MIELELQITTPIEIELEVSGAVGVKMSPKLVGAEVDPVAIAIIGNRVFTEQNYITSNQTVTESLDALDLALAAAFIGTIDGGSAGSVYLSSQETDGGSANEVFQQITDGGGANTIFEQTLNGGGVNAIFKQTINGGEA